MSRVKEVHRAWGDFTVNWKPGTPAAVKAACDAKEFPLALVRIFGSPGREATSRSVPGVYTGVILQSGLDGVSGHGPSWFAGTPGGSIWESRNETGPRPVEGVDRNSLDGNLANWMADILSLSNSGLTPGVLDSSPDTTQAGSINRRTVRTMLDSFIVPAFGMEWEIDPVFKVHVRSEANLYPTTGTRPVATRRGGRSAKTYGLQVTSAAFEHDMADFASHVEAIGPGGQWHGRLRDPPNNPAGQPLRRWWTKNVASNVSGGDLAWETQIMFDQTKLTSSVDLSLREYEVTRWVKPGHWINVWDAEAGFIDTTRPLQFRGEIIYPMRLRCHAVDWPIRRGMGVWLDRGHMGIDKLLDLTPHVDLAEDDSDTMLTVGREPPGMPRLRLR